MDTERAVEISLIGTTERLIFNKVPHDEAIAELQRIAAKHRHLLSDAAGYFQGAELWNSPPCYQLLVDAGADDQARIKAAADRVLHNRAHMGHTTAGTQSLRR